MYSRIALTSKQPRYLSCIVYTASSIYLADTGWISALQAPFLCQVDTEAWCKEFEDRCQSHRLFDVLKVIFLNTGAAVFSTSQDYRRILSPQLCCICKWWNGFWSNRLRLKNGFFGRYDRLDHCKAFDLLNLVNMKAFGPAKRIFYLLNYGYNCLYKCLDMSYTIFSCSKSGCRLPLVGFVWPNIRNSCILWLLVGGDFSWWFGVKAWFLFGRIGR